MHRLTGKFFAGGKGRLACLAPPQLAGARTARPAGQRHSARKMVRDMVGQRAGADRFRPGQRIGEPDGPLGQPRAARSFGPGDQVGAVGKGRAVTAQPHFQRAGPAQVVAAILGAGIRQRVLQQCQQRVNRQPPP